MTKYNGAHLTADMEYLGNSYSGELPFLGFKLQLLVTLGYYEVGRSSHILIDDDVGAGINKSVGKHGSRLLADVQEGGEFLRLLKGGF